MKKLYKQLMKTSALICLLILGTGNAWGATSWNGYNSNSLSLSPSLTTWVQLGSTGIYIQGTRYTVYTKKWLQMASGMKIKNSNDYDGIVLLRFQYYENGNFGSSGDLTITGGSEGWNPTITVNTKASSSYTSSSSNCILLKMEKGEEYTITYTNTNKCLCLRHVTIYQESELKTFKDTEENTNLQSTIEASGNKVIQINRTLIKDKWNTFCLPFEQYSANNALSLSGQLDCDAVYRLDSFDGNTITFKRTTIIADGYPYLIKPKHTIDNPLFFCSTTTYKQNTTESNNGLSFVPTFKPTDIYTTGDENSTKFYLNNDGYLVYPTSNAGNNGKIKGFRAYFEWAGGGSVKDMTFVFDDSETTGIKTIEHDIFGENGRVYSIDGRYMGDSTDNLSRGIYIQNGRKFVVK